MVVVFMTFALAGPLPPKEMGFILAVAVLLDASLVRLLLQPVVLRLLGPHAWWMPAWLDRLLPDVGLTHEMPEAASPTGVRGGRGVRQPVSARLALTPDAASRRAVSRAEKAG
jgi:uncharacterized membrane protein YdfJ with MMPL/SSD domain